MGGGSWTSDVFCNYTSATKGMSAAAFTSANFDNVNQVYKTNSLAPALNPKNIMRECCDSEEHPNTLPVILALDVTGSMGSAAMRVAQKLNEIMTNIYADKDVPDVEFCIMGIGDIAYDEAPIQMSQFESDIRIAEQLDQIYFEAGGGRNNYESYTAAWYMGVNHCKLDCWNRGKKGIIITLGDECPNPYLGKRIGSITGNKDLQADVETDKLLKEVQKKFKVYHIAVDDNSTSYSWYKNHYEVDEEWKKLLGGQNYVVSTVENLPTAISDIVKNNISFTTTFIGADQAPGGCVSW